MSEHSSKSDVNKASEGKTYHHGEVLDDTSLKGLSRYLNSSTIRGRANVAKLTFGSMILGYFVIKKVSKTLSGDSKTASPQDSVINPESA